ncbi:MAG: hypothetical protein K2M94_02855 [Paramuribaculum sp.]|nr:hypothetical protein [Paramuribaculum sp.]
MNILEAIKVRRSVRSFDGRGLTAEQKRLLEDAINKSHTPFGGKVTIRLKEYDLKAGYKPNTYGMIKGAADFFLIGMGMDEASALSAGFRFEQVVLKACQLGLGTCWIAATFKNSDFDRGEEWSEGETLKVISPVGTAVKPTIKEKLARLTLGSKNRKPFDRMFFYNDFTTSVPIDNPFRESLEMLRLAPSSTNSQPWRVLVKGRAVHFYYKPKSSLSVLDTGIGICHFYETEKYYGRSGEFSKIEESPAAPDDWKYLVSYFGQ